MKECAKMADVEEVAMLPPQTDQEEENAEMEENKSKGEENKESEENKENQSEGEEIQESKEQEDDMSEAGENVVDSENNAKDEKQVWITLNVNLKTKTFFIRWRGRRLRHKHPV